MAQALTFLYEIYGQFITLVFNDLQIESGVTVGWICVAVTVLGILINTILNIPRGIQRININGRSNNRNN